MRNRYFVCYDVRDPQRLAKTYKKMQGYGDPVQYSVFSCELNAKEKIYMKEDLENILNLGEDSVLIIDIGPVGKNKNPHVSTMGVQKNMEREAAIVI